MLVFLRALFGVALLYQMMEGARRGPGTGEVDDLTGAYYLVVCVGLAILNAMVWAPYLGAKVSGPLAGTITASTYVERTNWILRLIRYLDARRYRGTVSVLCFFEAIRHPSSPAPLIVGFNNSRPGSWLEKVYAREVFRFNNTQNCVQAYLALKRHGIDPRPHPSQEVNIVLLSLERPPRPEPEVLAVPVAVKPAPLKRNPRIRLFKRTGAEFEESLARADAPAGEQVPATPLDSGVMEERPNIGEPAVSAGWLANLFARVVAFIRAH